MTTIQYGNDPDDDSLIDMTPDEGGGLSPKAAADKLKKDTERALKAAILRGGAAVPASSGPRPPAVVQPPRIPSPPSIVGAPKEDKLVIDPEKVRAPLREEIGFAQLDDIEADYAWNVRSGEWTKPGAGPSPEEEDGRPGKDHFASFCANIGTYGLKEAVHVRRMPPGSACRYGLVNGFRRYTAVRRLAGLGYVVPNLPKGQIAVKIYDMSDRDARMANVSDNTNRDNLSTTDLAKGIGDLHSDGWSESEIAVNIGRSEGFVGRITKVMTRLPPTVTTAWRNSTDLQGRTVQPLNSTEMSSICPQRGEAVTPEDLENRYTAAVEEKNGFGHEPADRTNWMKSARKKAAAIGTLLGTMVRDELFSAAGAKYEEDLNHWMTILEVCGMKLGGTPSKRQRESIAKGMIRAYIAARDSTDNDEETLETDE